MKDRSTLQADVVGLLLDLYGFSLDFKIASFHYQVSYTLLLVGNSPCRCGHGMQHVGLTGWWFNLLSSMIMYIDIEIHRQGVKVHNE